jgi:serine/threonine protein kinase
MLLFINGVKVRVFMESFFGTKFKLRFKNGLFNCFEGECYYHLENFYLKLDGKFVNFIVNKNTISYDLSDEINERSIKTEREKFDVKPIKHGGYAYIYNPSILSGRLDVVSRVSYESKFEFPPELHEEFSKYCLIPLEKVIYDGIYIEEYKMCNNVRNIIDIFRNTDMNIFLKRFRNLYEGIELFESKCFFHGDISPNNIVLDNDEFKFIDYDFSLFYNNNTEKKFSNGVLYYTIPIVCNMIINHFFAPDIKSHNNNESSFSIQREYYYNKFKYGNFNRILIDNIISNKNDIIMFNNEKDKNVFSYVSIYQLTISLLFYINVIYSKTLNSVPNEQLNFFLEKVLNFKKHGFITIQETLELFDQI